LPAVASQKCGFYSAEADALGGIQWRILDGQAAQGFEKMREVARRGIFGAELRPGEREVVC
jgi:hypothetical protein